MNSSPSIGSVGLTIDQTNGRIKILCDKVFCSAEQAKNYLAASVSGDRSAQGFLSSPKARLTARVIVKTSQAIQPFAVVNGFEIREEARIQTAFGLDIVYLGGNGKDRTSADLMDMERSLCVNTTRLRLAPIVLNGHSHVTFDCLTAPVCKHDADQLVEMYQRCFRSYPVRLGEALVQSAAQNSIFVVARNSMGHIIASAIGESLQVGPLTLLEVSEEAAHPEKRIKGAASNCARQVIEIAKDTLPSPVVAFWEARMWRNILGISQMVGLTQFGGVLHQHCRISSTPQATTLPQTEYGSLGVFYAP